MLTADEDLMLHYRMPESKMAVDKKETINTSLMDKNLLLQ